LSKDNDKIKVIRFVMINDKIQSILFTITR